jgi:hypothetical protein
LVAQRLAATCRRRVDITLETHAKPSCSPVGRQRNTSFLSGDPHIQDTKSQRSVVALRWASEQRRRDSGHTIDDACHGLLLQLGSEVTVAEHLRQQLARALHAGTFCPRSVLGFAAILLRLPADTAGLLAELHTRRMLSCTHTQAHHSDLNLSKNRSSQSSSL